MISRIKEYTYDQEADAIYITFSDKPVASTRALDDIRVIDYAADGSPVGIERKIYCTLYCKVIFS